MKSKSFVSALVLSALCVSPAIAAEKQFASPGGNITVSISDEGGKPTYTVALDGTTIVERSPLGLMTNIGNFTQGLTMGDCEVTTVNDEYTLKTTKQSHIVYTATEAVCHFTLASATVPDASPAGPAGQRRQTPPQSFDIIFRVTDRDVAFRYKLYPRRARGGETLVAVVEGETSGFVLPEGTTTFLCPQSKPMGGFARTSPSYETSYTLDEPAGKNGWGEGYSFPCLFKVPINSQSSQKSQKPQSPQCAWVLISETGTDGGYVGCRLLNNGGTAYAIGFPQQGEMNGQGTTGASVCLPCETPWRTLTMGTSLKPVVETTVANDLVKPKYKASRDYTYGKGSWSWIIGMDSSCNFDEQKRYIDFSAAMGFRSVLVDALWDTQIGYEKMEELSRYAQSKGVGLFLWYNSNGTWNDAPQGPRHKMDRPGPRRHEMEWMQKNGILGIKVDFFGGDKQAMMQLYEDILTDANDYGIQCIFHGCTLPRGWERMFPNYVASEAVLASENLHFGQGACDAEAFNACIHPFIRNTVGSMDFGGSTLNKYYNADNQHGTIRRTSDVFALATAVIFQASVQHFAMAPNNLTDAPAWAVDFMKEVPTNWDETLFIDGYPGKYCIMARRADNKWYVAGINAADQPVKQTITLPMFDKGQTLRLYSDDDNLQGSLKTVKQDKRQQLQVVIPKNGAVVIAN
jgi:hypothetical protein